MCISKFFRYYKLRKRKWEKLSLKKRYLFLQNKVLKYTDYTHIRFNIKLFEDGKLFEGDEDNLGFVDFENQVINLNKELITNPRYRFDAMVTIFHETRHIYQMYIVSTTDTSGMFSKAKKWQKNFDAYLTTNNNDYVYYTNQEIEVDAQKYSYKKLKSLQVLFKKDSDFQKALKSVKAQIDESKNLAKEKLGVFYKHKIRKQMKKQAKLNKKTSSKR